MHSSSRSIRSSGSQFGSIISCATQPLGRTLISRASWSRIIIITYVHTMQSGHTSRGYVSSLEFQDYCTGHYGRRPLCRVPGAHGKAPKAHGKPFAVCRTRQSAHGNQASAKPAFAVCYISGTRQRVCRVPLSTHGKIK